jgi:hypothetical protein
MKIGETNFKAPEAPLAQAPEAVPAQAGAASMDPIAMQQLLQIMLLREQRLSKVEEEAQRRIQARKEQYARNAVVDNRSVLMQQRRCTHLKGGKTKRGTQQKDFNLSLHTFTDNTTRLKCLACGMKWFPYDTEKWLIRNGRAIPNHTHLSWNVMLNNFATSSSNTSTSSEVPMMVSSAVQPTSDAANADRLIREADAKAVQ